MFGNVNRSARIVQIPSHPGVSELGEDSAEYNVEEGYTLLYTYCLG